jgi:SRSO17 transposase
VGGLVTVDQVTGWADGLASLHARIAHRFSRSEPRRRALAYLHGLIAPLERKNGWTLAESAGEACPDGMQQLLNAADWDADAIRDDVRAYVVEQLGDASAVLIVDDTGFVKKGTDSAGVQRQYTGTAGKTENCQIGVFLAYASPRGQTLIDRELYLPQSWIADRVRCRRAGIGDDVGFATKIEQAQAMISRTRQAGVPFAWLTADEAYGQSKHLRVWLEQHEIFHVLATRCTETVVTGHKLDHRVDELIAALPRQGWQRRSCGQGAHGLRLYDWARVAIRPWHARGRGHWVLARRSITDPSELAYYVCFGPARARLVDLVGVAGARWAVEECFQTAKTDCGLDHYQVRRYAAWYRHVTLAMAVQVYLSVVRAQEMAKGAPRPVMKGSFR